MSVARVEVSTRVLIARFQDPLNVLRLIGCIEILQFFRAPNKYFIYIHTPLIFPVSKIGTTTIDNQPRYWLNPTKIIKKYGSVATCYLAQYVSSKLNFISDSLD